ncbi:52 kDa repressor of the inhibitor of the protein kinase-like [Dendronephthya gigantea]|uniref:52 kDa repressor of the inhibitor of the protein kinase-like n=1 Tax=Dendronephthya gigantea TaxID=151771 RepID=UPI00106C6E57|nr:52 kDa repressor of the inhibitor of the protein kinase-like [Dendronephthya gigantea]
MSGETKGIDEEADNLRSERIAYNRKILCAIVETVVLAGRQNIALRGHRDDSQHYSSTNPGNFQAFLNYRVSGGDKVLADHFKNAKKNATYRSKTIQNKLVKISAKQIESQIISEINNSNSPFYSVLTDEAADCGNKEQMPIFLRYVDGDKEINKRFIRFVDCQEGMTGLALANNVEGTLEDVRLPLPNCRGQGYDGASAMSSQVKGVSGRILEKNPKALYVHCSSHRLNLIVAKACSILPVKNMLSQVQKIASFFSSSPIRSQYLSKKMKEFGLTRNKLAKPSTTRWVEQITSLDGFLDAFEVIYETLNFMQFGGSQEEPFPRSASDAQSRFRNVEKFEFMAALVITQHVLDHTLSLTVQLQKKKIDIVESIKQINLLKDEMAKLRASVDLFHNEYYNKLLELANNLDVAECYPRVCKAQTKCDNHPTSTACDYNRLTVTIPLIDHVITEIEYRFPSEMCNLYNGFISFIAIFFIVRE